MKATRKDYKVLIISMVAVLVGIVLISLYEMTNDAKYRVVLNGKTYYTNTMPVKILDCIHINSLENKLIKVCEKDKMTVYGQQQETK